MTSWVLDTGRPGAETVSASWEMGSCWATRVVSLADSHAYPPTVPGSPLAIRSAVRGTRTGRSGASNHARMSLGTGSDPRWHTPLDHTIATILEVT